MISGLHVVAIFVSVVVGAGERETALDRYIRQPDPAYKWKLATTIPGEGYTTYVLDLTSQQWRTDKEVDRPEWKHWLTVVVPDQVEHKTGLLYIGGGTNGNSPPEKAADRIVFLATQTRTVCAELGTVPNQPLRFADTPMEERVEDDIIAYTRVKYMKTKDETWLVRLAMVKSAVRAMDAVQEFLRQLKPAIPIDSFVVSGASKRGWTTWLTAVVDERVVAIIPLVIDALNSEAITRHHYEAYGFFSKALDDYVRHGLFPNKVGTPEYKEILAIEDPFNYRHRERLKIPKYLVNASGDEFFLPDNSRLYFAELPEEKYLRYVPNTKHNLEGSDALQTVAAFYQSILNGTPLPKFSWQIAQDGTIVVNTDSKPTKVLLWQATNPDARDFRLDVIGPAYQSSELAGTNGVYTARVPMPAKGFTAYFVELLYDNGGTYPLKLTTDVSVVPDVLPYDFQDAIKKPKAE